MVTMPRCCGVWCVVASTPSPTDRVAWVGKTGSGKTYGAYQFLRDVPRLIVIDPKHSEGIAEWGLEQWDGPVSVPRWRDVVRRGINHHERRFVQQRKILSGKENFQYVFSPAPDYDYESLWGWIWDNLQGRDVTIYIDELYLTLKNNTGGKYLRALYTQGREKGIGTWASMQRPTLVPLICLTECEWFFVFRLTLDDDKKRMSKIIGKEAMADLKGHSFFMYNQEWDKPEQYDNIENGVDENA